DRTEPLIFSPLDPHTLYYATNFVFKTRDGGNSWQTISPDLTRANPGAPASVGTLIPKGADTQRGVIYALSPSFKSPDTLWAGTENGVWVSFNDGDHWQSLQLNLPHTSMRDLWINESDLIVATHGRSFWILDDISLLRELAGPSAQSEDYLFKPAPAYRVQRD